MNRYLIAVFLIVVFPLYIFGQEDAKPGDPDIVLPPMMLTIEDLDEEHIIAEIPTGEDIFDISIDMPLPGTSDIGIEDIDLDVILPTQEGSEYTSVSSFYSEGLIGIGNKYHLIGDISLFKTGDIPQFSISFSHDSIDGFGEHQAGESFFSREDELAGTLDVKWKGLVSETEASYLDSAFGLQGLSDYHSVTHRFFGGDSMAYYEGLDHFSFGGGIGFYGMNRVLESLDSQNLTAFYLVPELSFSLQYPWISAGLNFNYEYEFPGSGYDNTAHRFYGDIWVDGDLPKYVSLGGTFSLDYTLNQELFIPFSLYVSVTVKDFLFMNFSGGYEMNHARYYDLWQQYPVLGLDDDVSDWGAWFADAYLQWRILNNLTLEVGGKYQYQENEIELDLDDMQSTGLYGAEKVTYHRLNLNAEIEYDPIEQLSLYLGWTGDVLDSPAYIPDHIIDFTMQAQMASGFFGGSLNTRFLFYPEFVMPVLSGDIFIRISDGIRLYLEAKDILSLAMDEPRILLGDYEDVGFDIVFKASISL